MRRWLAAHYTDSGFPFDEVWTEEDIVDSDWGRLYFEQAKNPSRENCIETWLEITLATELSETL